MADNAIDDAEATAIRIRGSLAMMGIKASDIHICKDKKITVELLN